MEGQLPLENGALFQPAGGAECAPAQVSHLTAAEDPWTNGQGMVFDPRGREMPSQVTGSSTALALWPSHGLGSPLQGWRSTWAV